MITIEQLARMAGTDPNGNMRSVSISINRNGAEFGLDKPHRLAHFLAQLLHESGRFKYDREIWGPTAAQKRYDTRVDLGNTPEVDGDGKKNAGRGPIQLTGGANIKAFHAWCKKRGYKPPDFVANPDLINTDQWEGLSAIFYWATRNLNKLADENNIEQITKKVNGGLNGYADRIGCYIRAALVLLGYSPTDVKGFQIEAQKEGLLPSDPDQIDSDPGPKTRAALHMKLASLSAVVAAPVTPSPVVTETVVDVKSPGTGAADAVTGAGVTSGGLSVVVGQLQEQLTPYSMAGGWIGNLVIGLIILSAVLTIGGLIYRFWAMRKKSKAVAELNAAVQP